MEEEQLKSFTEALASMGGELSQANRRLSDYNQFLNENGILENLRKKTNDERIKREQELNEFLAKNNESFAKLNESEKEKYKSNLKNQKAYDDALKSINRYIDNNGKLVKETNSLTLSQQATIKTLQAMDAVQSQMMGNVLKLGTDLIKLGISTSLSRFSASIQGAIQGTIAFQDAILDGAGANAAAAAQVSAQMNALADSLDSTGTNMISLGAETAKTAAQMILLGGPIGALIGIITLLVGAAVAYEGYEEKAQAQKIKRDAELQKKQAAIYDELYKDFTALGESSLTSAGGMTTLWKQLGQLSMSVKDFSKFNKILVENSQAMASFGAGAIEGVQKFTDVAGSVVKSGLGDIFRRMGMTNEDMAEHTAKYMEQQNRLGLLQGKSVKDLQKGTANYIFELDRVATLTGQTRKEQEKARESIRAISQLRAAQFIAREKGDTKEAERLKTIENYATAMNKYDPTMAAAIAKRGSGAALDSDQVVAMRYVNPVLDAINKGENDTSKLIAMSGESAKEAAKANAGLVRLVGDIQGFTANFAGIDDLVLVTQNIKKAQDEAKAKGKEFNLKEYLEKQRISNDSFTNAQADAAQKAKETQIAFEKNVKGLSVEFPNMMGEAMKKYLPEAFSGPLKTFLEHIIKFGSYVAKLLGLKEDTPEEKIAKNNERIQQIPVALAAAEKRKANLEASAQKSGNPNAVFFTESIKAEQLQIESLQKELARVKKENAELGAPEAGGKPAQTFAGGSVLSTTNKQLADAGLHLKQGDVQKEGAKIDPRLIEIAKLTQQNVPGFLYFSGFNDQYHNESVPTSRHTKGLAFDFVVNPGRGYSKPTKEHSDQIIKLLKSYGIENVRNEYDDPSKQATGGHFHAELPLPKGYDGGIFEGPKAGFPVELHGREAIIPLPNPNDKISIDRTQKDSTVTKSALSSALTDNSTNTNDKSSSILSDLYSMMEEKFDDLIDKVNTNNNYTNKLLKYSQV